jgi:hypothetical protein
MTPLIIRRSCRLGLPPGARPRHNLLQHAIYLLKTQALRLTDE